MHNMMQESIYKQLERNLFRIRQSNLNLSVFQLNEANLRKIEIFLSSSASHLSYLFLSIVRNNYFCKPAIPSQQSESCYEDIC